MVWFSQETMTLPMVINNYVKLLQTIPIQKHNQFRRDWRPFVARGDQAGGDQALHIFCVLNHVDT